MAEDKDKGKPEKPVEEVKKSIPDKAWDNLDKALNKIFKPKPVKKEKK